MTDTNMPTEKAIEIIRKQLLIAQADFDRLMTDHSDARFKSDRLSAALAVTYLKAQLAKMEKKPC